MREPVIAFCLAAATLGATPFASSRAQAMPLAGPFGLNTAIDQATATKRVTYICRQGSHGRRCRNVSRPDRYLRYDRSYANGAYPHYQSRPTVEKPPYNPYYWGGPLGESETSYWNGR
jgi:hypothetical protein